MKTGKTHVFVPDIHGNLAMLERILEKSGAADRDIDGRRTMIRDDVQLTLLGDLIDRGSNSLDVLALAQDLHNKGAVVLAGNHDIAFDAAMRFDDPGHIGDWCVMGGIATLRESALKNAFVEPEGINEPMPGVAAHVDEAAWKLLLIEEKADYLDMRHAFAWLRNEYRLRLRTLFTQTEILARPLPGVMAVHAGVGSWMASMGGRFDNVVDAWRALCTGGETGKINGKAQEDKNIMAFREAAWMRRCEGTGDLLSRNACAMLRNDGRTLVIRGHDITPTGVPVLYEERKGVHSIDVDGGKDADCYLKIPPDGGVIGGSATYERLLGMLENGVFRPG